MKIQHRNTVEPTTPITPEAKPAIDPLDPTRPVEPSYGVPDAAARTAEDTLKDQVNADFLYLDSITRGFTYDNNAVRLYNRMDMMQEADPNYNAEAYIKAHGIAPEDGPQFRMATSAAEAERIRLDMQSRRHNDEIMSRRTGVGSVVARGLGSIVDIDTPIAIMTGPLAGTYMKAGRFGKVALGAATGGGTLAAAQAIGEAASTAPEWSAIPMAGFMGMMFGAGGAALLPGHPNHLKAKVDASVLDAAETFRKEAAEGAPVAERPADTAYPQGQEDTYGSVARETAEFRAAEDAAANPDAPAKPQTFNVDDLENQSDTLDGQPLAGSTVGSAQLNPTGTGIPSDLAQAAVVQNARTWAQTTGIPNDYYEGVMNSKLARDYPTLGRAAQKFHDVLTSFGLATDFDKLMRSGSAVGARLAYDLMENAPGFIRNNQSAAMLQYQYQKTMLNKFTPAFESAWNQWANIRGLSHWDRLADMKHRVDFQEQVIAELQGRFHDGPAHKPSPDKLIRDAADATDELFERDIDILVGRPGEHSVYGADQLTKRSGYFPQRWVGSKMMQMIATMGPGAEGKIVDTVAEGYLAVHPNMAASDAKVYAKAVVRRALKNEEGVSTSLIGILQHDGRDYLRQTLMDNGVSATKAERLITKLTGEIEERQKQGSMKQRVDIDMRHTSKHGIRLMDIMDTDIGKVSQNRARATAGAAALARKGIRSQADRDAVINTILAEQAARGGSQPTGSRVLDALSGDKHVSRQELEDMFSAFTHSVGQTSRNANPWVSRMMKLTNLSLLSQVSLAQLAETGALISAVGWEKFMRHAGSEIGQRIRNKDSELVQELKHADVFVPEETMFRPDLWNDMDKAGSPNGDMAGWFDRLLNSGQRAQGILSGFYEVRNIQQRIAITSMADKIMRTLKDPAGAGMSHDRMFDIGLSQRAGLNPNTIPTIRQYIANGTIEFRDGSLYKLNLNKWNPSVVQDFTAVLNRTAAQNVQSAMIGETNSFFHRDGIAALFMQLKSFPLLAMQKQVLRHGAMADKESAHLFLYGLATAGTMYTIKQTLNGNTQNLTPEKIARGALGMSNLTGWLPMWVDPIAAMFGMDSLKLGGYSRPGMDDIVAVPAAMSVANRLLHLPGAAVNMIGGATGLTDGLTNSDIRALQAVPIVGGMIGVTGLLNSMKSEN